MFKPRAGSLVLYSTLFFAVLMMMIPILWMVSISVRTPEQAFSLSLNGPFTLVSYAKVFNKSARFFLNSLVVAGSSTFISLFLGTTAGYGLSRFTFTGKRFVTFLIMILRMFPPVLLAIGFFEIISKIGLFDKLVSLFFMHSLFTLPFVTWMMKAYFDAIPGAIDDAGLVDGCSRFGIILRLLLPVSVPGLVAVGIYAFLLSWNEFMYSLTFIQSTGKKLVTVALSEIIGEWWTNYPDLLAMSVLISIPMMLLFVAVQNYIVAGLAESAVKG